MTISRAQSEISTASSECVRGTGLNEGARCPSYLSRAQLRSDQRPFRNIDVCKLQIPLNFHCLLNNASAMAIEQCQCNGDLDFVNRKDMHFLKLNALSLKLSLQKQQNLQAD